MISFMPHPNSRLAMALVLAWHAAALAPAQSFRFEAEQGVLTGTQVASSTPGYSGTGYVNGFNDSSDKVGFFVDVPDGLYDLQIGYRSQFGPKGYGLMVGDASGSGMFEQSQSFTSQGAGQYYLDQPITVEVLSGWGYYDLDYVELTQAQVREALPVGPALSNPNATQRARFLMEYLSETYGQQTLFAQQRHYSSPNEILSPNYLAHTGGIFPAMIGSDLMDYSPSRVERGANPNGETERMISWAQETGGVVSLMWHWNAPTDLIDQPGEEWWRGFYTSATTFDLGAALANPSGSDYQLLIRDIDAIAVELDKYKQADIPVLWRPLHEAQGNSGGAWFWWGNSGADAMKELWSIMHDRLTNHHGLDNLIWATTLQVGVQDWMEWYPGDDMVDIVGVDVYSSAGDNMTDEWHALLDQFDGEKLIALTESGTLPPEEVIERYGVAWSYMMPWSEDFLTSNHSAAETQAIVGSGEVIDLSELPVMPWRQAGALPGDFNDDGAVDMSDFSVWREHYGLAAAAGAASPADANGDGLVDAADYTLWRDAYTKSAVAVPEPSSWLACALGLAVACRARHVSKRGHVR